MLNALRLKNSAHRAFARGYSTPAQLDFAVKEAAGIKVASAEDSAPTGAISVVVKAGSRFETAPGLAHVLKNSVFKVRQIGRGPSLLGKAGRGVGAGAGADASTQGTNKRSAIRLVRETEMFGGVLTSSLTREHLILTAEFMRGDE